jgi:hypothetical protein
MGQRFPKSSEISATLAALGVYAQVPTERELAEQAMAAGGERVLPPRLANALYGAAIGAGMLTEGRMLAQGVNQAERLSLARAGAEGLGCRGALGSSARCTSRRRTSPARCARSRTTTRRRSARRSRPSRGRLC